MFKRKQYLYHVSYVSGKTATSFGFGSCSYYSRRKLNTDAAVQEMREDIAKHEGVQDLVVIGWTRIN